jgi:hypothetical protein
MKTRHDIHLPTGEKMGRHIESTAMQPPRNDSVNIEFATGELLALNKESRIANVEQ